jgi:flagellar M-ring protein FliF
MLGNLRQQATNFWNHQSNSQRIILITLVLAAAIIIPVIVSWANTPTYAVAFSGLSEADAGQITQKLDEGNIPYKLQGTGTILVPTSQVYETRLMLARDGLPSNGSTVGFELFSGNTLGMTEFTQKVNYQRALEGELERTISKLDAVEAARVHIVIPEKTLLKDDQQSPTASVTIKVRSGTSLDASQVRAISHLVASSIEGMKPEAVVIVDTNGNMMASGSTDTNGVSDGEADNHRAAEVAAAKDVERKVQAMLDSVLGQNNSVVKASVEMDWSQRETKSQSYSPTQVAVRSSQKVNEAYTTNGSLPAGIPGASSNLPTPVPTTAASSSSPTLYQRSEETLNYEVSQTESKEVGAPGTIKRISLSVMVDGTKDDAQMTTIKNAVAAAAGIDTARGDAISVGTFAFDRTYTTTQAADIQKSEQMDLYVKIGEAVLAALIILVLLWYIIRLFRNLKLASSEQWTPVMRPVTEAALPMGTSMPSGPSMLPGVPSMPGISAPAAYEMPEPILPEPEIPISTLPKFDLPSKPSGPTPEDEQMQRVMARMTDENPATIADILQIWLNEDENRHG